MSDPHFDNDQKLVGVLVPKATGTLETGYDVEKMQVGLVQVNKVTGPTGETDYDLLAGAYQMDKPPIVNAAANTWEIELEPDSVNPEFKAGDAFGFVLVRLKDGRITGWIDEVTITP